MMNRIQEWFAMFYAAYADVMIQINSFAVFFVIYMVGVNGAQHSQN